MKAKDGYVFVTKDKTAVYGNLLYLGKYDSVDNYIELPLAEAEELKKEIEKNDNEQL